MPKLPHNRTWYTKKLVAKAKKCVKYRDNYTCQKCNKYVEGSNCHASHVLNVGTHKAFELDKKIETFLLYCSTLILQPPALVWAPNHITHHRYSDKEGDSHPASNGWKTWFWWNTYKNNMISGHTVKRLLKNKHFRIQYENYFKIYYMFMISCLLISPFYTLCMILIPATFCFHTSSITNVLCHTLGWGYRNFDTNDNSVNINIFPINCATLHNNHHANPTSINNGVKWYEIDSAYYVIKLISK